MIAPPDRSAGAAAAPLLRRLAATAYDSLLLGAVVVAVGFALLPVVTPGALGDALSPHPIPSPVRRALSLAVIAFVCGLYCVWLWSGGRRTLAMKTWRLALETADGAVVGIGRAVARYAAWWVGPALAVALAGMLPRRFDDAIWALPLLGLNYAWAICDPHRQFLHDRIAGTRLVVTGARASEPTPRSTAG